MHNINAEVKDFSMVDHTGKTKAEMLLELESIKGLLLEEDDIPILQEMIHVDAPVQKPKSQAPEEESKKELAPIANNQQPTTTEKQRIAAEQQDFFNKSNTADSATQLLNSLNDFAAIADNVANQKTIPGKTKITTTRSEPVKASGENPFLPQHIRTRLHGNNPPPLFEFETAKKIAGVSRPVTLLGSTQHKPVTLKPSHQQELIDEIIETLLPEIESNLRERLEAMSKEMLEILIAENK